MTSDSAKPSEGAMRTTRIFNQRGWHMTEEQAALMIDRKAVEPEKVAAVKPLVEALGELCDLVEASYEGNYDIDSFTTQPARAALEPWRHLLDESGE